MELFFTDELQVNRVNVSSQAVPGSIRVVGSGGSDLNTSDFAVIMGIGLSQGVNFQLTKSLDDVVYAYAFGNKPTAVTVSGIVFNKSCTTGKVGVDSIIDFYTKNRMSAQTAAVPPEISVYVAGKTFKGFLVSLEMSVSDVALRIYQFQMQLVVADV